MGKKEIGKKENTTVGEVIDYGEYAGRGFENQTQDDIAIPFIGILQGLSPQLETLDGAKIGMLMNTVTEELMTELEFVPAVSQHLFVEWVPRKQGGGFVGIHQVESDVVLRAKEESEKFGRYKTEADNDLSETFYLYGVIVSGDQPVGMAVIAFTSTKIKVYRGWNTRVNMFTLSVGEGRKVNPPMFAHRIKITTIKQKNADGEYYNFVIKPANGDIARSLLSTDDPIFLAAVECNKMVEKGDAKAAYDSQNKAGEEETKPVF